MREPRGNASPPGTLRRRLRAALGAAALALGVVAARADGPLPAYPIRLTWDADGRNVLAFLGFRSVIDTEISTKLTRGLPTTIVFTAAVYQEGGAEPAATTAQSCRVTWLVWEEIYEILLSRPGGTVRVHTPVLDGVLRRCAQLNGLVVGTASQLRRDVPVRLEASVLVNPVSPEVLTKIRGWVSRPSATGTVAPGDALFSTFSGLFLQRIGAAERELRFTTVPAVPSPPPPPVPKEPKPAP